METADVQHLAGLARIAITDEEAGALAEEFDTILGYVAQITEVSAGAPSAPAVGVHANMLREDIETHTPGAYTEVLLNAAQQWEGEYVYVKKIFKEK